MSSEATPSIGTQTTPPIVTPSTTIAASKYSTSNDLSWRPFVFGGFASVVAETCTFPIDTSKTRLQIQGQASESAALANRVRYRGMAHAIASIARDEGPRALYFGIQPALLRQATYGSIKFGVYYSLKRVIVGKDRHKESWSINAFCGVFTGATSAAIMNPTDVLKVRMQAQTGRADQNLGLYKSFQDVFRKEGMRGLWRGVGPNSQRAAVVVGVELSVYDCTKSALIPFLGNGVGNHFASAMAAGLACAAASTPIDVVKTRIMNQRNLKVSAGNSASAKPYQIYLGSLDCLAKTIRNEGFMALYKGFVPNWIRMGPWNVVFFLTFEQLKKL